MSGYRWGPTMLSLMIGLLVANGCASMRHGRSQVVLVESEPPGATILVGGEPAGVTPNFVELRRRGSVVTLEKDGFLPLAVKLRRSMNAEVQSEATVSALLMLTPQPLWAGLSLLGLTLGTDLATGAAWEFPEEVGATLEPAPMHPEPASRRLTDVRGPSNDVRTTEEGQ